VLLSFGIGVATRLALHVSFKVSEGRRSTDINFPCFMFFCVRAVGAHAQSH
jgi:hypothetical protein